MEKEVRKENMKERPPIVVVMGHVDHGKTSLLDYIRKTNVVSREAGGITQSIGAYEILHNGKKITFIDTPGHEAFSKMRERGANAADMAILIVAADDGVKPQTKESIDILNETKTPFVVAINKIDKPNADVEKTKNDLMQHGIFLEGYGGNVSWQAVSAKAGQGIGELLDLILLAAELEQFSFDPDAPAQGVIIEAKMDSRRGVTAIGIVKNGVLKNGDLIATASASGKIKILENFLGERMDKLEPSSPALVLGFETVPLIGEEFFASQNGEVKEMALVSSGGNLPAQATKREITSVSGKPGLVLILKADVYGSLEALREIILGLPQEDVNIIVLDESVGDVTDGDVKNAATNGAIIIGFNTKLTKAAESLAKSQSVKIVTNKIIYELVKSVKDEIELIKKPLPLGELEVLATFSRKDRRQLVGGKVTQGLMKNNIFVKVVRGGAELGGGKVTSLQSHKKEVTQVLSPNECGIMIESGVSIEVGDSIVFEQS